MNLALLMPRKLCNLRASGGLICVAEADAVGDDRRSSNITDEAEKEALSAFNAGQGPGAYVRQWPRRVWIRMDPCRF